MRKRDTALTYFKPCPKCEGSGKVLCDGMEYHRALHKVWADSWHLQPVMVRLYRRDGSQWCAGLAVSSIHPGGWGAVKVYFGVSESVSRFPAIPYAHSFDVINKKCLWYVKLGWTYKDDIKLLESWPETLQEILRISDGGLKLIVQQN